MKRHGSQTTNMLRVARNVSPEAVEVKLDALRGSVERGGRRVLAAPDGGAVADGSSSPTSRLAAPADRDLRLTIPSCSTTISVPATPAASDPTRTSLLGHRFLCLGPGVPTSRPPDGDLLLPRNSRGPTS